MVYNVVNVQLSHPSFSWGNGLYAVIEKIGTEMRMCKLGQNGKPELNHDDTDFSITCTGTNNKEVYPTPLKLDYTF